MKSSPFDPAQVHLDAYATCISKQKALREQLALPKNNQEDRKFCEEYYNLYFDTLYRQIAAYLP